MKSASEASSGPGTGSESDTPPRRALGKLGGVLPYLRPYRLQAAGAAVALTAASAAVLVMGVGLRTLVDEGFRGGDAALLDDALAALFGVIAILTMATYARFFLVSWIGERVVADIRRDVCHSRAKRAAITATWVHASRSGWTCMDVPSPRQVRHALIGLLNMKKSGARSPTPTRCFGQPSFW